MLNKTRLMLGALPFVAAVSGNGFAVAQEDAPAFANAYGDHMVLQRDREIALRGTGEAGERITVSLGDREKRARVGDDGTWSLTMGPLQPGPALELSVRNGEGEGETLSDILVGDVWLCSGQSNMEYPVSRALNPDRIIAGSADETIRLLKIEKNDSPAPLGNFKSDLSWQVAGPETVGNFSAVCHAFAQDLRRDIDVPLGLIDSSWGGSQIEAWMSADALRSTDLVTDRLGMLEAYAENPEDGIAMMGDIWEGWWAERQPDDAAPWAYSVADYEAWQSVPQPFSSWTEWGTPETDSHTGIIWFAKTFTLTEEQAEAAQSVSLGGIDEVDVTWVNGEFLNSSFGYGTHRIYGLENATLQAGENTLVVSVYNSWAAGGMTGPDEALQITFEDGSSMPIADGWTYRVAPPVGAPPSPPWTSVTGLTGIYNAMIAPLEGLPLKGALWYQGESDTAEPETYETYLAAMIEDWRGSFGAEMPFIAIQLANYGTLRHGPTASGWAGVRNAQRAVAVDDPNTGTVVTIDAGNPRDIHPADKKTVGDRAARVARSIAYGMDVPQGPVPVSAISEGDRIVVTFDGVEGSLQVIGNAAPTGVEVCPAGEDCRYVAAEIADDSLIIDSPVSDGEVRYCWADAPVCTLYDEAGLPASPFGLRIEG